MGHRPLGELGVEYSVDRLEDPAETEAMPHGIFECQPCIGKRIITLTAERTNACKRSRSASHFPAVLWRRSLTRNLQVESHNIISCVITGNTYNFRSRMD